MENDPLATNILGVKDLMDETINKSDLTTGKYDEMGEPQDILELPKPDDELLDLAKDWESEYSYYEAKITPVQNLNLKYYLGKTGNNVPEASNILFSSEETFLAQALAKNPDPVVWSDNTLDGKADSDKVKTYLQYLSDTLVLKKQLALMLRHWSVYMLGVVKHGWDKKTQDITLKVKNPQKLILDPKGHVDVKGNFKGRYLGERISLTLKELKNLFPKKSSEIENKMDKDLGEGTLVQYIEWWNEEYCFSTWKGIVLEKHKNEFFNYGTTEKGLDENNEDIEVEKKGKNHFSNPEIPYTFLSIFSLQERPHDITTLIEQNIENQKRIIKREKQIDKNIEYMNNSIIVDQNQVNEEVASQIANSLSNDSSVVLAPKGTVERIPSPGLPSAFFDSLNISKQHLEEVFGVSGLSPVVPNSNTTVRGQLISQSQDATRISGAIGSALEQVADNIYNWWVQMMYVFYDEDHYGVVAGKGDVSFVKLNFSDLDRQFVVSVIPDSMAPKDDITEMNQAIELANSGWLDPINLFKALNYPDPMEISKMVVLWKTSPQMYMQMFFPETAPQPAPAPTNPLNMPQEQGQSAQSQDLSQPANANLNQVPINNLGVPK